MKTMSDGLRIVASYLLAVAGAYVYVKFADGVTGIADAAVFAACTSPFVAIGVALTYGVEPGGLRRWRRRARRQAGPTT